MDLVKILAIFYISDSKSIRKTNVFDLVVMTLRYGSFVTISFSR